MVKRTRNKQLNLKFTQEEFDYIAEKKRLAQVQNYTDFILKIAAHSNVFVVDTKPLLEVSSQINKIGVNINQIAKVANTTQSVYKNEIEDLKKRIGDLEEIIRQALRGFSAAQKGKF